MFDQPPLKSGGSLFFALTKRVFMSESEQPVEPNIGPNDPLKERRHLLPTKDRKVPSLEADQTLSSGGKFGISEDDIEKELLEAMGGMSEKEIFAEPIRQGNEG